MHKKIYLSVILGILFFVSCKDKKQYYEESGTVFHTLYTIKYEAPHILTDKIDAELQKFNLSLNPFNPNSIIAKVNNNEAVEVDEWFTEVFNKSMEVSRNSDGVFDITCAPLVNLWGSVSIKGQCDTCYDRQPQNFCRLPKSTSGRQRS